MIARLQFVKHKKIWFSLSVALVVISLGALVFKGLNFGLEFTGGTSITWRFDTKVQVEQIREEMARHGLGGSRSIIQPVEAMSGDDKIKGSEFIIRTESLDVEEQGEVLAGIKKSLGGERQTVQTVGAAWGKQVTESAAIALGLSLLAILIYITVRFEYKMAFTALIALAHDIVIAVGIYALVGREVSPATIAAFLTILGYSLYDTIVVFHRVLENARKLAKETYSDMVNNSVNQVMVRSLNTSVATLVPVIALLLFGGDTLKDFAFALLVGFIPGTYSSIFLASPLLAWWKEREPRYAQLGRKVAAAAAGEERQKYSRQKAAEKRALEETAGGTPALKGSAPEGALADETTADAEDAEGAQESGTEAPAKVSSTQNRPPSKAPGRKPTKKRKR